MKEEEGTSREFGEGRGGDAWGRERGERVIVCEEEREEEACIEREEEDDWEEEEREEEGREEEEREEDSFRGVMRRERRVGVEASSSLDLTSEKILEKERARKRKRQRACVRACVRESNVTNVGVDIQKGPFPLHFQRRGRSIGRQRAPPLPPSLHFPLSLSIRLPALCGRAYIVSRNRRDNRSPPDPNIIDAGP